MPRVPILQMSTPSPNSGFQQVQVGRKHLLVSFQDLIKDKKQCINRNAATCSRIFMYLFRFLVCSMKLELLTRVKFEFHEESCSSEGRCFDFQLLPLIARVGNYSAEKNEV